MAKLLAAYGYEGDAMNLPVADARSSAEHYVRIMGMTIGETSDEPHRRIVLRRDAVQMALAENGGNPTQDGVAFHVDDIAGLFDEFVANGWEPSSIDSETRFKTEDHGDDGTFKVFYLVAPDGLCFWFGQRV